MSQVITNAFEQYWQSSLAAEQPVVLDEFILADIPNLDITSPIDPDAGLPPESQIVHRQNVDQRGRINNNAVAYTIVMDTTVGDFSFNAMYLRNKQNGVIGMIVYKGRETKLKTDQTTGQTGNSLVKSMLMGYDQAAEATLTHVDAGTWQIDYAARLRGQDEDLRQLASQLYGHHTFIGDGFKVVQQDGGHQVTPGVAIVGGLRIELKQPEVIYPGTKPIGVWVDVHRSGSLLSEHQNHFTIITSVADLADHVDSNGYQHYVAKLATVQADGSVVDGRGITRSGETSLPESLSLLEQADAMLAITSWEALRRSYAELGYILVAGSFGEGATLTSPSDVVLDEKTGRAYSWTGSYPTGVYIVPPNSSPVEAAWVDRSPLNPGAGVVRDGRFALRDYASIKDVGVVGNGLVEEHALIQNLLNTVKHVVVPAGMTPLIGATITVPVGTKLEFLGGLGSLPSAMPASHFIKKSTMTTAGIVVSERAVVIGGGLYCQPGNSGDGIHLVGQSSRALDFYVCQAGRDGVRCGTDGTYSNCNMQYLQRIKSTDNGRYGIYVHDGVSVGGADANVGSLIDCIATRNGADGIRLGHCFWTLVQNCNAESNGGYGLYLSGIANGSYPECRYPTIVGGDYNEGNNGTTNINQVYDGSYFATFIAADHYSIASNPPTGLQGGGYRNAISGRGNYLQGLTVHASAGGIDKQPLIVENGLTGGQTFPMIVQQKSFGSNGNGPGIKARIDPNAGTYIDVGSLAWVQAGSNRFTAVLSAYNKNTDTMHSVALSADAVAFIPGADGALSCGHVSTRWSTFFGQTGTINTSDANEKTTPRSPEVLAEYLGGHQDAILDAWGDVQIIAFQWLASIQKKGEDVARWHFGVIAQQVRDAFIAHGLDGCRFGLLCYDEWTDEFEEILDDEGKPTGEMKQTRQAGNRWGIRADQCLFLEAAYQRRRSDRIEARLADLETKLLTMT